MTLTWLQELNELKAKYPDRPIIGQAEIYSNDYDNLLYTSFRVSLETIWEEEDETYFNTDDYAEHLWDQHDDESYTYEQALIDAENSEHKKDVILITLDA
jgi:hypothetical protein